MMECCAETILIVEDDPVVGALTGPQLAAEASCEIVTEPYRRHDLPARVTAAFARSSS